MSIISAAGVPTTSADIERLSIITSTPVNGDDEPGRGSIYVPTVLAGGHLIHTHSTNSDVFLAAFGVSWRAATANASVPGAVTAKTVLTRPTFYWIRDGVATPAVDRNGTLGYIYPRSDNLSLIDGASDGGMVYYLCLLNSVPIVLFYRAGVGILDFIGSSWVINSIPMTGTVEQEQVIWNKGITSLGGYLYVVGERPSDHALFLKKMRSTLSLYLSNKGWDPSQKKLSPLRKADGSLLTSLGPVSVAIHNDQWYIAVTSNVGGNATAGFFRTRHPLTPWQPMTKTIGLGSVASIASTNVRFQPSVAANPQFPALASATDSVGGLPLCYSVESATAIRTSWDVLPIPFRPA